MTLRITRFKEVGEADLALRNNGKFDKQIDRLREQNKYRGNYLIGVKSQKFEFVIGDSKYCEKINSRRRTRQMMILEEI